MASSDLSKVLNLGSYGVVVHPALQNDPPYNNDPHSYITKVFYRKEDYNDIQNKKKRLFRILGPYEEGYQFKSYEREWKGRNLPEKVYRLLSEQLNNNNTNSNKNRNNTKKKNRKNNVFYPIRMLHLGKSIDAVLSIPELLEQFRQCELKHIIASFVKLFDTVTKLSTHHTIHGDIHSQNILIYMAGTFCEMSLIDYDLFESYEEMKKSYEVNGRNYIYGPPEVYHLIQPHRRESSDEKGQEEVIRNYVARISSSKHFEKMYPDRDILQQQVRKAIDQHGDKPVPYHHIDSFMLCSHLLNLMYRVYPFLYSNKLINERWSENEQHLLHKVKVILESGVTLSSSRRSGPQEIQKNLQRILCKLKGIPSPPSTPPPPSSHRNTKKNNSSCVISGGIYKTRHIYKKNAIRARH